MAQPPRDTMVARLKSTRPVPFGTHTQPRDAELETQDIITATTPARPRSTSDDLIGMPPGEELRLHDRGPPFVNA